MIAIDDGVVIATHLDQILRRRKLQSVADIRSATMEAGLKKYVPACDLLTG